MLFNIKYVGLYPSREFLELLRVLKKVVAKKWDD